MIKHSIKIEGNGINVSSNIDTFDPSTNNYIITDTVLNKYRILAGTSLSKSIFEAIDFSVCTFVYIQLSDIDIDNTINDARFTLTIAGNIIGNFSQFYLANGEFIADSINVDTIPSIQDTYLTIIIGTK